VLYSRKQSNFQNNGGLKPTLIDRVLTTFMEIISVSSKLNITVSFATKLKDEA